MELRTFESLKILVIEDHTFTRRLLRNILVGLGVSDVTDVAEAEEALAWLAVSQTDVVVCDIVMQPVDGLEFLRRLRSGQPLGPGRPRIVNAAVPVVMLTAHANLEMVEAARAAGASGFIAKPVAPGVLRERIMAACRAVDNASTSRGCTAAGESPYAASGPEQAAPGRRP
jgi:two-component system chemotaxis response regulator CheY